MVAFLARLGVDEHVGMMRGFEKVEDEEDEIFQFDIADRVQLLGCQSKDLGKQQEIRTNIAAKHDKNWVSDKMNKRFRDRTFIEDVASIINNGFELYDQVSLEVRPGTVEMRETD